jgi:glycosyltransferase involved in cell wall biosynthesis
MRILVVQESDWLEKGPHQGHHLMERLSQRGHIIRVIDFEILWKNKIGNEFISKRRIFDNVHKATNKGRVTVIRPPILKLPILDYVSLAITHSLEIRKQIREYKPDIIIGFGILNAAIAIYHAKSANIPFVYYIIDELHRLVPENALRGFARFMERSNLAKSDLIFTINDGLKEYAIEMGANPSKIVILRAGIDSERFNPNINGEIIRKELGFHEDDIVLFFMGWLYKFSGLKEIATELAKQQQRFRKIRLLIIGKGELKNELERIRDENKLDDTIKLLDWKPYDDLPRYICASDICILPADNNEIMKNIVPIKMYEYMAMGKPVIATMLPGIMKEFGNDNGVLYVKHSRDVLQLAIDLKRNNLLQEIGIKALTFVRKNDWETIVSSFEDRLKRLI